MQKNLHECADQAVPEGVACVQGATPSSPWVIGAQPHAVPASRDLFQGLGVDGTSLGHLQLHARGRHSTVLC